MGMDPNETLRLLQLTVKQMRVDEHPDIRKAHADEIAEQVEALDEWLTKGGFLPGPWERKSDARVTMQDLHALTEISDACIHGYKVARLFDGNVIEGVARSIGDEKGNFLRRDEDVRDGYLRVSGIFDYFWPIRDLMPQIASHEFVVRRGE